MSHCYRLLVLFPSTHTLGLREGLSYCIWALRWAISHTWLLPQPTKKWRLGINNLPKVIPEAQLELNPMSVWHTSIPLKPKTTRSPTLCFVTMEEELRSWKGVCISALPSVWGCGVPPLSNNLQSLLVPQTDRAVFLQKSLSLYPPRTISGGHHLRSVLNDPGAAAAVIHRGGCVRGRKL